jgi:hypothetical protein
LNPVARRITTSILVEQLVQPRTWSMIHWRAASTSVPPADLTPRQSHERNARERSERLWLFVTARLLPTVAAPALRDGQHGLPEERRVGLRWAPVALEQSLDPPPQVLQKEDEILLAWMFPRLGLVSHREKKVSRSRNTSKTPVTELALKKTTGYLTPADCF